MTLGFVSIDGTQYNVPLIQCDRTINTLDRFAQRTQDGWLHRQLIGVYYNYQVAWAKPTTSSLVANYAALWLKLAEATEWHTFIVPDGYTFVGYVGDGVKDSVRKIFNATVWWENLSASFIAQAPAATP